VHDLEDFSPCRRLQDIERRQLHSSRLRRRPDLGWIVPLLRCEIIIALADWQAAELESLADFGDADMLLGVQTPDVVHAVKSKLVL
jgi:hypothetical protein